MTKNPIQEEKINKQTNKKPKQKDKHHEDTNMKDDTQNDQETYKKSLKLSVISKMQIKNTLAYICTHPPEIWLKILNKLCR